jgi:glucokinase
VSRERVVSGPGLVNIYEYLVARGDVPESVLARREMERGDRAAVIAAHALAGNDPLSMRALDMFASAYGAQAANLALTVMATGGVYVAGGIAPRIVAKLRDGSFIAAFRDKGRMSDVLARVPVHVIVNPHTALIGAATEAHDLPTMPRSPMTLQPA